MNIKDNIKNIDTWIRGFFILVFGVIFYLLYCIIWLLVIFQFITKVLSGKLNSHLKQFSTTIISYTTQVLNYVTFQSEERPFPFSPFSAGDIKTQIPKKVTKKKSTPRKKTSDKK